MKKSTLVLIIVLAVAVIGGGVYFTLNWGQVKDLFNKNNANSNSKANANLTTNSTLNTNAVTNVSLPSEVKGDTTLNGTITVSGVKLHLSSLDWTSQYNDLKAESGKTLLVVYLDAIKSAQITPVVQALAQDIKLQVKGGTVTLRRYKIASDEVKNDRGYLLFEVPNTATEISVICGTGPSAETVSIPAKK